MDEPRRIAFVVPYFDEREAQAVAEAVRSREVQATGAIGQRCEKKLREMTGAAHCLLTTSGTSALELALMALEVGPGDEVIVPSFTFVSTANAVIQRGARPVFAEVREETLNIDPEDVRRKLTRSTRGVIPVHYAGVGCEMDAIMEIAGSRKLFVLEDAAQGVDAWYKGRALGAIGTAGCLSFHHTKNITCGEGGALLTSDERLWRRAEIMREKGTNRSAFLRGEIDKYTWVDRGSSYVLSDILAAVLEEQIGKREEIRQRRKAIYGVYETELGPLGESGKIILPVVPAECTPNYHIYWFRTLSGEARDGCLRALKERGVQATFHYVPLHSSPFARERFGLEKDELPVTERVAETLVRLPIHPLMSADDARYVVRAVKEFFE